jgi:hypothetical protein
MARSAAVAPAEILAAPILRSADPPIRRSADPQIHRSTDPADPTDPTDPADPADPADPTGALSCVAIQKRGHPQRNKLPS